MAHRLRLPYPGPFIDPTPPYPSFITCTPQDIGGDLSAKSNLHSTWLQPGTPKDPQRVRIWFVDFRWTETGTHAQHSVTRQQIANAWVDLSNATAEAQLAARLVEAARARGDHRFEADTAARVHTARRRRLHAYALVDEVVDNLTLREVLNEIICGWIDIAFDRERGIDDMSGTLWPRECHTAGFYAVLATPQILQDLGATETIRGVLDQAAASLGRPLVVVESEYWTRDMSEAERRLLVQAAVTGLGDAALDSVIDQLQLRPDKFKLKQTLRDIAAERRAPKPPKHDAQGPSVNALPTVHWADAAAGRGPATDPPALSSSPQPPTRSILLHRV